MQDDLKAFFLQPKTPRQRQYEALRAYAIEGATAKEVAKRFGFTTKSLYALVHDFRTGKLNFFPKRSKGPKETAGDSIYTGVDRQSPKTKPLHR